MAGDAPEMAIALPRLNATTMTPPVRNASDGIAEAYMALAATLRQQDSDDFAMILLRLSLDLRPDFTAARVVAADILSTEAHYENALQMLAPVSADDPLSPVIRLQRAALAQRLGHTDEASHELQRVARDFPDSPLPAMREGDMLRDKQHFVEAVAAYDRAIARIKSPTATDWLVYYDRGMCYDRSHQWSKAEADFKHALDLVARSALRAELPRLLLGRHGHAPHRGPRHDREGRATPPERRCHRRQPRLGDAAARPHRRCGQGAGACRRSSQPEDPQINGHLGDAYWAAGRRLEATYQWRRALTFNPEPADAAKLEAKLQSGPQPTVVSGQ